MPQRSRPSAAATRLAGGATRAAGAAGAGEQRREQDDEPLHAPTVGGDAHPSRGRFASFARDDLFGRYDRRHGSRHRSPRRGPRRLHRSDPRRAARRQGRVHREGARARRNLPAGRVHPDEGVGADRAFHAPGARHVRQARRDRRRAAARLREGERVEGRRRQADDRRRRRRSSRRTASSGSRAPARSRARTRSASRAARTSTFKSAIVATGSFPLRPPIPGLESDLCVDSTGLLAQTEVPRRLVILGGGIIGAEFASIFSRFGSEVTIIEMLDTLIPQEDADAAKELAKAFGKRGITLQLGKQCTGVEQQGNALRVSFGDGESVDCDLMLVVGRPRAARRGHRARGGRRRVRQAEGHHRRRPPPDERAAHLRGRRLRRLLAARAHRVPRGRGRGRERVRPRGDRQQPRGAAPDLHRSGDRRRRPHRGAGARAVRRRRRGRHRSRGSRTRAP